MRNLLMVCAALVIILGIVSGNMWNMLRADRQNIADLQTQLTEAKVLAAQLAQVQVPQPVIQAQPVPTPDVQPPTPTPVVQPVAAIVSSSDVLILNSAAQLSPETRRADALRQADQNATGRVLAWQDRLTLAGQTLTTPQLQALNTATITENRREAEESLAIESATTPMDIQTVLRLREENINRMNETNQRILQDVSSQLNSEQLEALRDLFEKGHASRQAGLSSDRERIGNAVR